MENVTSIVLPSGHTVEIFKNGEKLVVALLDGNGYGVSHEHLTESQINSMKELIKLF